MSEVKLLPLPAGTWARDMHGEAEVFDADQMDAHARANMEPLIAENERLRAKYQRVAESSEHFAARAERLAEALQGGVAMLERLHGDMGPCEESDAVWGVRDTLKTALARAALDQEGGNG